MIALTPIRAKVKAATSAPIEPAESIRGQTKHDTGFGETVDVIEIEFGRRR